MRIKCELKMPKKKFTKEYQPIIRGKPSGPRRTTCIRQALENVFNDSAVLEQTILQVIATEPNEILKLLAKLAPQKLEAKLEFPKIVVETIAPKNITIIDNKDSR